MTLGHYALPLGAALAGNLLYHLASRSASASASAFATMAFVYLIGAIVAGALALGVDRAGAPEFAATMRQPSAYLLAIAVLTIEVGFLLAYKAGAPVSSSSLIVNALVAAILAIIGVMVLKEAFGWRIVVGIIVTLSGVAIMASSRPPA